MDESQGGETTGEAARVLIEDVHDAIFDLVELIKTFQSKNKLSKLFLSTLFKRRQEELDAVVDRAITRLQVSGYAVSCPFQTGTAAVISVAHKGACSLFYLNLAYYLQFLSCALVGGCDLAERENRTLLLRRTETTKGQKTVACSSCFRKPFH